MSQPILADFNNPILFRTASVEVRDAALTTGSLWLRSDRYYRELEDKVRNDNVEGVSVGKSTVPIRISGPNGVDLTLRGDGLVGNQANPHYLFCMHGTSISAAQLASFGGCSFGIKNYFQLCMEIFHQASLQISATGFRYGPVTYQFTALTRSNGSGGIIRISDDPPISLNAHSTDVLRKRPIPPFIEQDEWRIAIFTDGYLNGNPDEPLKVKVRPSHFYAYEFGN